MIYWIWWGGSTKNLHQKAWLDSSPKSKQSNGEWERLLRLLTTGFTWHHASAYMLARIHRRNSPVCDETPKNERDRIRHCLNKVVHMHGYYLGMCTTHFLGSVEFGLVHFFGVLKKQEFIVNLFGTQETWALGTFLHRIIVASSCCICLFLFCCVLL